MWRAEDLVILEPAVLVNSFDVTGQKEVEQQLEAAKRQLLIQNQHLELRNNQLEEVQEETRQEKARLLEEQQGLQDQLKKALELHLHPKTSVDTATVVDKIISMFDDMLQLMHRSGLSQDVGASMIELLQMFNIPEQLLLNMFSRIEEGYPDNPYHNRVHAASVFHMMHLLIHNGLIQQGVLDGITMLGCYLAAICHDYDHSGFNNDHLIKTKSPLAITYNDMIKPTSTSSSRPDGYGQVLASLGDLAAQQKMLIAQVGFFEIVALPLFKQYVELLPMAQPVLDAVKANYQYWHHAHHMHDGCSKDAQTCGCSNHH
ncbi:hypothetical protein WJX74_006652 [Apatococcus lobatus]|uniref:PDEase domain-containing protein n=1 Tax=Apatococcus lobatus TaxID=904363 RepID=A0AAW1QNB9_9CHLO